MSATPDHRSYSGLPGRIWLLAACHVAAAVALVYFQRDGFRQPYFALLLPTIFAQICLLAMLATFATSRNVRDLSVCAGLILLGGTLWLITREPLAAIIMLWVVFVVMSMVFGGVGARGYSLQQFGPGHPPPAAAPVQFTIRQLFWTTAVIALFLAPTRWTGEAFDGRRLTFLLAVVTFLSTPLLTSWAALGCGRAVERGALVLAATTAISLITHFFSTARGQPIWFWPTLLNTQTVIMLGSLLVVRSCGYRLVKRPRPAPTVASGVRISNSISPDAASDG